MADGKIPVFATAVLSFRFILTHRRALLRFGSVAVPAFFLVTLGLESPALSRLGANGADPEVIGTLLGLVARAVIAAAVLVGWHRVVMLGTIGAAGPGALGLGFRELRYLIVWIVLSVGFLAVFAIAVAGVVMVQFLAMVALYFVLLLLGLAHTLIIGQRDQFVIVLWIAVFFAVPVASYVTGRLTLVLPALAVDRPRALRQAWRMSAGNGWRLVFASLLVLAPMESVTAMCGMAAANARYSVAYYPLLVAGALCLFLLVVATGTVLSLFSLQLDRTTRRDTPYRAGVAAAE